MATTTASVASSSQSTLAFVGRRLGVSLASTLASVVIIGLAWELSLKAIHANPYVAKTPGQVLRYLASGQSSTMDSGQIRSHLAHLLLVTLGDAAVGFVVGAAASCLVALLFTVTKALEVMFLPIAMGLCTVPLLAVAPVIFLLFGNGLIADAFICGVVVFFPILVNVTIGLRSASPLSLDLVRVYGGRRTMVLRKVALPSALPYLFASLRVAAPSSIGGAMLYEWLFTFKGLGAEIVAAKQVGDYNEVWAITLVVAAASILAYVVMTIIESFVLAALTPAAGQQRAH